MFQSPRLPPYFRLRPSAAADASVVEISGSRLRLLLPGSSSSNLPTSFEFSADRVFSETSSQEEVFVATTVPLLEQLFEGYNSCIFGYGQTGTGKTFTMVGSFTMNSEHGICLQTIPYLFRQIQLLKEDSSTLGVSIMEIYNELLIDLLQPTFDTKHNKLAIMESTDGIKIPNLFILPISSDMEAVDILQEAYEKRKVASHFLNHTSSRSHVIYTFYITRTRVILKSPQVIESKIHFVDLAGSEKTNKTKGEDVILTQANYINKSLTFLEQVVLALTQSHRKHIPYRQSKLTHALKDCLGGNCFTYLIACIWGTNQNLPETLSTLKFASRMTAVVNKPSQYSFSDEYGGSKEIKVMREHLRMLKAEIIARDSICGPEPWLPELTEPQKKQTYKMLQKILTQYDESLSSLQLHSLSQAHLLISSMRDMLLSACGHDASTMKKIVQAHLGDGCSDEPNRESVVEPTDIDPSTSFGIGPLLDTNASTEMNAQVVVSNTAPPSFDDFKASDQGEVMSDRYEEARRALTKSKRGLKDLVARINQIKASIDEASENFPSGGGIVTADNDEGGNVMALRERLHALKAEYRDLLAGLRTRKEEVVRLESEKQNALNALLAAYRASSCGEDEPQDQVANLNAY